ncbi:UNVERIFIED_CONTAM: hypothetical protein FKN15_057507 [Acipenser sinensis]
MSIFDENETIAFLYKIKRAFKMEENNQNTLLLLDVLAPEITIKILKTHEGFCRFQAEVTLATADPI